MSEIAIKLAEYSLWLPPGIVKNQNSAFTMAQIAALDKIRPEIESANVGCKKYLLRPESVTSDSADVYMR